MRKHYWAVRPKSMPDQIRIEHAETPHSACWLAFGRPISPERWEAKDLGTRVSVIQSDNKRIALLKNPEGWETISAK